PTNTWAPARRSASARSSSRLTKARTGYCFSNSMLTIVLLTEPTSPPAPVIRMGFRFDIELLLWVFHWAEVCIDALIAAGSQIPISISESAGRGSTQHRVVQGAGNDRHLASRRARVHS